MTVESTREQVNQRLPARLDYWIASGIGLAAFAAYVRTLVPGLIPNDGAEFQALAWVLDHAHTTGYEVYLVLAKLFTLLPIGDVAYRVNLFSAFMAAVAVCFTFLAAKVLCGSRWGAALAASVLAVSSVFWSQAIIAEVVTAGCAFSAAVLFFVLLWHETRRGKHLLAAGVLGALGFGAHGSVVLLAPAVLVLLLFYWKDARRFWKPALAGAGLGIFLFLLAFTLVDFNQTSASIINTYSASSSRWDLTPAQFDSYPERLAFLVFARQWRPAMFADPGQVMPENDAKLTAFFNRDFTLSMRLLMMIGLAGMFLRRPRLAVFFLAAICVHLFFTLNYRIGDIYIFFPSLYLPLLLLAADGAALCFTALKRLPGNTPRVLALALGALLLFQALAPSAPARIEGLKSGELRFDFMGLPSNRELATWREIIRYNTNDLPQNAVVLADWEDLYSYIYTAHVEQHRPDLLFLEANPFSTKPGLAVTLFDSLRADLEEGRPVLAFGHGEELERAGFSLKRIPVGVSEMYLVDTQR